MPALTQLWACVSLTSGDFWEVTEDFHFLCQIFVLTLEFMTVAYIQYFCPKQRNNPEFEK